MNYFIFGPSGSGKGVESFSTFIIEAFKTQKPDPANPSVPQGRDVFGNIKINVEKVEAYLGHPIRYRFICNEDLRNEVNWPILGDPDENGDRKVIFGKLFTPGCLIVVDECRSVWRNNESIPHRILKSIDTQRHFATESGWGIDVLWMGQTKKQFHRDIRDNGECYYKLLPTEELNIKDAHKMTMFSSWSCSKADMIGEPGEVYRHNTDYYGMFDSVVMGRSERQILDTRIRAVKYSPGHYVKMIAVLGVGGLVAIFGIFYFIFTTFSSESDQALAGNRSDIQQQGVLENAHFDECTEPQLVSGGGTYVVRDGGDGFSIPVVDDGTCSGSGSQPKRNRQTQPMAGFAIAG